MQSDLNNDVMSRISSVVMTLNNIEIKGKQNLYNMIGAIGVLEETLQLIAGADKARTPPAPAPAHREEGS